MLTHHVCFIFIFLSMGTQLFEKCCLCCFLTPFSLSVFSSPVLIMWACFLLPQCWCDLTLPLLTVGFSFYQPSSLFHITSNPSIFSLFPSSWITIILNFPLLPKSLLFLCLLPQSFHVLIPILLPVPPPLLLFCLPPSSSPSRLPLPLCRTSGRYGVCAEQHVCTWMKKTALL